MYSLQFYYIFHRTAAPGDSGCGEVCVSGSLAAAEHSVLRGGGVGVSGWSLLQLQRMTPLFRQPLRAVKLEMDFLQFLS